MSAEVSKNPCLASGARTFVSPRHLDGSAPIFAIPVRINGAFAGCYKLYNLFYTYGNGDGEDDVLCMVADNILTLLLSKLGYVPEAASSLHNNSMIDRLARDGKVVWRNEFAGRDLSRPEVFAQLWRTLPEDVRRFFVELAVRGLDIEIKL